MLSIEGKTLTRFPDSIRKMYIKPVTFLAFDNLFTQEQSRIFHPGLSPSIASCVSRSCCSHAHHSNMKTTFSSKFQVERIYANISEGKIRKY